MKRKEIIRRLEEMKPYDMVSELYMGEAQMEKEYCREGDHLDAYAIGELIKELKEAER